MIGINADPNKDKESLDASKIASSMLDAPSAGPKRRGSIRRKSALLGLNMEDSDSSDDESNKKTWLQPIFGEITPELEGSGSGSLHVTGSQDITVQDLTLLREGADPIREFVGIANPLSLDEAAGKNTKAYQGRLRYGDIDQNGFPDIFITL